MIIYVDIDETICNTPNDRDYSLSEPIMDRIDKINQLYDEGNTIIYWTARGTGSGIDCSNLTYKQLFLWGCKFHEIKFGKPVYDIFVDEKNFSPEEFFSESNWRGM